MKSHYKVQEGCDGGNGRVAQWIERVDDPAQDSRPLPSRRIQTAVSETLASPQDVNSTPKALPQLPEQLRLRDTQEFHRSSRLDSSQIGLLGAAGPRDSSIGARAGSSLPKKLPTRRSSSLARLLPRKSDQSASRVPSQATKASLRTEQSNRNDDSTDDFSDAPPIPPRRSPYRPSPGTNGTSKRSYSNKGQPSSRDAGPNPAPNPAPVPGSAYSTGNTLAISSQVGWSTPQRAVPDFTPRAPMLPSRNLRRGSTSLATASTRGHEYPDFKNSSKASARSDSLAALQQGARHVLATRIQQPKVVKSASSTRKSDVYASNPQLKSTSTARLPTRADGSRSEFQNGPPVSTAGHETDIGGSRTGSIATPSVSSQKYRKEAVDSLKCIRSDVMVNYLYQQALWKSYVSSLDLWQGIVLKERRGKYSFCPPQLEVFENGLLDNVKEMNVCCAMTVSTPVTRTILESMQYVELDYVPMPNGLRVQVLKTMSDLPRCQIHHFAAFLEDLRILVVWDDDPEHLLQRAEDLEAKFVKMIWGDREEQTTEIEKTEDPRALADEGTEAADLGKLEAGTAEQERRPVRIVSSVIVGFTVCLAIACMGLGWRRLAMECKVDKNFLRLALLVLTPVQLFFSMVRETPILNVMIVIGTNGGCSVFLPSSLRQHHPDGRPDQPDQQQFEVLFRNGTREPPTTT